MISLKKLNITPVEPQTQPLESHQRRNRLLIVTPEESPMQFGPAFEVRPVCWLRSEWWKASSMRLSRFMTAFAARTVPAFPRRLSK